MYKVLIVEDEMLVRMGLKSSIDWARFDMKVIADAADGKTALSIYEKEKPDIIITDLKMPMMGGMELITSIREKDRETRIIILSCLEEFDLVRKAVMLGVSGYILKLGMSSGDIEDVLFKVRDELRGINASREEPDTPGADIGAVKENILKDYIFYKLYSDEELSRKITGLKCRLNPDRLVMCLLEIDQYHELNKKFKDERGRLIRSSMLNVFNELLEGYGRGEVFQDAENRYAFIFSFSEERSEKRIYEGLYVIIEQIRKVMKTYFNISVFWGVSSVQNGYCSLERLYGECKKAVELKFFMGLGKNLQWSEGIEKNICTTSAKKMEGLLEHLHSLNVFDELLKTKMGFRMSEILQKGCDSKKEVIRAFFQLMDLTAFEMNYAGQDRTDLLIQYMEKIKVSETLDEIFNVFRDYVARLNDLLGKKLYLSKGVVDVIRYIKQHFDRELSVQELADFAGFTPNYVSSLFKKEVGTNLADYINSVRLEKAKELLLNTNMRSYEIAEKVGFSDDSYFIRVFRKAYSETPNEFRKKWTSLSLESAANEDI